MAWLPNPVECDVCQRKKGDSNHWFYAEEIGDPNEAFHVMPWDYPVEDRTKNYIHLCGPACVIKKIAEWMNRVFNPPVDSQSDVSG